MKKIYIKKIKMLIINEIIFCYWNGEFAGFIEIGWILG